MDDLSILLENSLNNYFDYLKKTGYMPESYTNQLMLLSFLQDFIKEYAEELEEDSYCSNPYGLIRQIINCLYSNSCLINWNKCEFELPKYWQDSEED